MVTHVNKTKSFEKYTRGKKSKGGHIQTRLFSIYPALIVCYLQPNWFKRALTSFGVTCEAIAHWIQSRFLYLATKFQGLDIQRTRATS